MTIPLIFEDLLTRAAARQYITKRFSVRRAWAEVNGSGDRLTVLFSEDMKHFQEFRDRVRLALCVERSRQPSVASEWKSFLKARIEMLDHWSSAVGAFATFCAGVFTVGSVATRSVVPLGNIYLAVAGAAAAVFAINKFVFDSHKYWYKYLVAHLEAIERVSP